MTDKALTVHNSASLTVADAMTLAEAFARSGFFSDANDAAKAIVKIQAGRELGVPPVASMTGISIVKNRVTIGANILAGLVKRHPAYDYRIITHDDTECSIEFFQDGDSVGASSFTMEDAQRAGLATKDNWRNWPRNMLFARAISNGVKWFCPDVTSGIPVYTPDEMDQPVNEDGSLRLFAVSDQLDAVRARLRELFPEMTFLNDGNYNYMLKRNGYPKLSEMTGEQAANILETLGADTPTVIEQEGELSYEDLPSDSEIVLDDTGDTVTRDPVAVPVGRDVKELLAALKPVPETPDFSGWRPNEMARFCSLAAIKLNFTNERHAKNALLQIFPEAEATPPAWADAWMMLVQHQQEAGRLA